MEAVLVQGIDGFLAQLVPSDGADGQAVHTELGYVIGKIGGRAAQFLSGRENVPEDFPDSNDILCHITLRL